MKEEGKATSDLCIPAEARRGSSGSAASARWDGSAAPQETTRGRPQRSPRPGPVPGVDDEGKPILYYQFGFTGNEGLATAARLSFDRGQVADPGSKICYDGFGNLYICDTLNHCVRYVDPSGVIHQFAGVGPYNINTVKTYDGDGGPATQAHLLFPRDVAADASGNIYIADTGNNVIRKVDAGGTISTVVGHRRSLSPPPLRATAVLAENGKSARKINLTSPYGIEVDWKGRLWISDTNNNVIRVFDPNQ